MNRIVGCALGELRIVHVGPSPRVIAKLSLVSSTSQVLGWTHLAGGFSEETLQLIAQVSRSIERDCQRGLTDPDAPSSAATRTTL